MLYTVVLAVGAGTGTQQTLALIPCSSLVWVFGETLGGRQALAYLSRTRRLAGQPYRGFELVKHGCYHAISQTESGCSQRGFVLLIMICDWGERVGDPG